MFGTTVVRSGMRAVVQRVSWAKVSVEGSVVGAIGAGLCVLVGVGLADVEQDARLLARKVVGLRIFEDDQGKMNRSVVESGGALLAVSQFTLYGDARKGRRPSFTLAMEPGRAAELFEVFCDECRGSGVRLEQGRFRAHMLVELGNDGPVTLLLDSARTF
jgi:D-tyrosyl-tRNA(Tyr) deacylase